MYFISFNVYKILTSAPPTQDDGEEMCKFNILIIFAS